MSKPRILLVDDSDEVREAVASMLARRYDVVTACDAADALERLRSGDAASVVVSDYTMPGEDGIELLARVKREWPHKVGILLSACCEPRVAAAAVERGQVFRFLSKPTAFDTLASAIDAALALHSELETRAAAEERLRFAHESLTSLTELANERHERRLAFLERAQHLALELAEARALATMAELTARAVYELFPRRGVLVQLWDATAQASIDASAGPEMSDRMWRLSIGAELGEIVIDVRPMPGDAFGHDGEQALRSVCETLAAAARGALERQALERAQRALILEIARLTQARASSAARHLERIGAFCRLLAQGLRADGPHAEHAGEDLGERWIQDLVDASALHDIGEVCVPDSILLKPGQLSPAERQIMMRHVDVGAAAIEDALRAGGSQPMLELAREICAGHHERWDGSGYPKGSVGASTPLSARIVAVADVYDALTTARPYRAAWTHAAAVEWIRARAGTHFDPRIVDAFLAHEAQLDALRVRLCDAPPREDRGDEAGGAWSGARPVDRVA